MYSMNRSFPFPSPLLLTASRTFFCTALMVTIALPIGDVRAADIPTVIISELMAANNSLLRDEDGDFSDWIELRNHGGEPVNLQGLYLTDSGKKPAKFLRDPTSLLLGPCARTTASPS